jgi:hypothetical protein
MNSGRPPRLAVSLLKWFGLANDEAFVGDLIEEYRSGRTAGWFWRQTLTAIRVRIIEAVTRPAAAPRIVAYALTASSILGFLLVNGTVRIPVSETSVLSVAAFLLALAGFVYLFRPTGYWGRVVQRSAAILLMNCVIILPMGLLGGNLGSPRFMFWINVLWFSSDAYRDRRRRWREGQPGSAECLGARRR